MPAAEKTVSPLSSPFPIWNGPPPLARGASPEDTPILTPYASPLAGSRAPALLVLPGGGYGALAEHEGADYAGWFSEYGIRAFVLRYRLGSHGYRHPSMLADASRAMRLLRSRAVEFGIDPGQIGVIGSSAGGHLAATLMTKFDEGDPQAEDPIERESSRPDLGLLCYPVISLEHPATHAGSRANLLGENAMDSAWQALLSAEKHVSERTPPCFIWHTVEDTSVPIENSFLFASALRAAGIPFALHIYERGAHGLGLGHHGWAAEAIEWLSLRWPLRRSRG
jgi:acetyl esterase/lipase